MEVATDALESAARREIDRGLTACQLAVAREGELICSATFGAASRETRFWVASATKPIVASAIWLLIGDGQLDVERPVADYVPGFGANGKQDVTVEQVLLMTSGFPNAPMSSADGGDPERRRAQLSAWTLESEPGTQYAYHGMSAHWVLAELIEQISGQDFCRFVEDRVTKPLGLPRLLGIPLEEQGEIAQLSAAASPEVKGLYPYAEKIAVGEPGGGGLMTAASLALFYQGLLHNPGPIWDPDVLADATTHVRSVLPDPLMGQPANRTLGVVVGAGFGSTWGRSKTAFGWPGVGGQIGFAEPATGISFAFLQMGEVDEVAPFTRGVRMSNLALELGR